MEQFGKYQLLKRLGAGGMAEVFLARSAVAQGLAKLLVIKKIHSAFARSKHFVTMFFDEAKIALGLNHPNIVQVFDFGHVSETYYLAMEYVEGVDVLRLLQEGARQGKRVPYGLCAYLVQQISKGLDYAHRKADDYGEPLGIVHRDISPQNVLVSLDGAVKIVDFGIARARDVHEEEGVVKGKFAYMSPEQARGEPVDRRSDIFSAGVVLFELACARPLFVGKGKEILDAVKAGAIPRPRDCDPHLPLALEEIILRALAYHADDRYQTARDLQNALGRFQFEHAKGADELLDSGTLAAFIASVIARDDRRPPTGDKAPVEGAARPAAQSSTAVGKRSAGPSGGTASPEKARPTTAPQVTSSGRRAAAAPPSSAGGATAAAVAARPLEGETRERKRVLVLEGELTGLSSLRRRVGDARAKQTVTDFFKIAENVAYKHEALAHRIAAPPAGGEGAEATGGTAGFTYIIGLPVTAEDDPPRAIRLALALVDALDGIGRDVEPELRLSVGIQRGVALLKRKSDQTWEYEVSDGTTSIARRLSREAQGGEVLVGGGVFRLARAEWNFEELATIDLPDETYDTSPGAHTDDGESGPRRAKIYRLRGIKEREQRMRDRRAPGQLVAREAELSSLRDVYQHVTQLMDRRYVLIVGEEGVGKRTLVNAFVKSIPAGEAMVVRAVARAATSDTPFSIIADLARDLLGLAEGAEPREVQRRLQMTTSFLYPGEEQTREVQAMVQAVGSLLGIKMPGGAKEEEADPEQRFNRVAGILLKVEERLSRDQPLVLSVEDIHWADSQSWDLFHRMVRETSKRPVLYIGTARPDERVLEMAAEPNATAVIVEELDPDARMRLILDKLVPSEASGELAREIAAKAGGNPLFIREIIESLVDRGILMESREPQHKGKLAWVKRDAPLQVPTSIEAVVATRLDRLPPHKKDVVTRAAVLGSTFSLQDVAALVNRSQTDVAIELVELGRRGLVKPDTRGGDAGPAHAWAFKNEMTMSVAYDLLPPEERTALHRAAADRLVKSSFFRPGHDDFQVARHLELGGDEPAAARRYLAAAKHAGSMKGSAEAFRHLSRAIALLPRDAHAERYEARAEREAILRSWARRPQQLREIHLLRREAEALDDPARAAQAMTRLATFYQDVGKIASAKRAVHDALEAAKRAGDKLVEAEVLRVDAALRRLIGENAEALKLCTRALQLVGDDRRGLAERAQILNIRGSTLWGMSRLREALEAYAEALVIHRKLKNHRHEARALNNMGIVLATLGEWEESLLHYKRSLKIDQELGDRGGIALKLGNIGQCYLDAGDLDRAEQYLTKALVIAEQLKDPGSQADVTITLGQTYLKRGDAARAYTLFERGLEIGTTGRIRYQEIRARIYLAMAMLVLGHDGERALALAREARAMAREAEVPIGEIYGATVEGQALAALGRAREGLDSVTEAVTLLESARSPEGAEEIYYIRSRIARAAGREAEARDWLDRAYKEAQAKARRIKDQAMRNRYLSAYPARDITADHDAMKASP